MSRDQSVSVDPWSSAAALWQDPIEEDFRFTETVKAMHRAGLLVQVWSGPRVKNGQLVFNYETGVITVEGTDKSESVRGLEAYVALAIQRHQQI